MVMATSLLQLLHDRYAEVQVDILAPSYLGSLLTRVPPVAQVWPTLLTHGKLDFKKRWHLAQQMRAQNYDQAIVLPNSFKSALIPWLAKIPQRTGWCGEMRYGLLNDLRILDQQRLPMMVQRLVSLGLDQNQPPPNMNLIPSPQLVTTAELVAQTLCDVNLTLPDKHSLQSFDQSVDKSDNYPILALCVGAEYGEAKRWPARYFAAIAANKFNAGWEVWLFGGSKDVAIAAAVQQLSGNVCLDLTGRTTLAQAVDLLSLARVVVTNDTGLMHVAAALNLPLVAIYGSSSPQFTPPLMKQSAMMKMLSLDLPCQPCFERRCPLQHFHCMLKLSPDLVLHKLDELIKFSQPQRQNPGAGGDCIL